MGLLDSLFGRTKPVAANLDDLFALPSAAVTLQAAAGMSFTGRAGVCWKPPAGQAPQDVQHEIEQLLAIDDTPGSATGGAGTPAAATTSSSGVSIGQLTQKVDSYGYRWLLLEDTEIDDLVARVHLVNTMVAEAGWGPQLLCSVFSLDGSPPTESEQLAGEGLVLDTPSSDAPATSGTPGTSGAPASDAAPAAASDSKPLYLVYLYKRGSFYPFAPDGKEQRDNEVELRMRSMLANDLKMEPDLSRWFPLWDLPVR